MRGFDSLHPLSPATARRATVDLLRERSYDEQAANVLSPKYVHVSLPASWLFFKAVRTGLAVPTSVSGLDT